MLNGLSGSSVILQNGLITKTSNGNGERLVLQAKKQIQYSEIISSINNVATPKVLKYDKDQMVMEYVQGLDFVEFLTQSSKPDINFVVDVLLGFVSECLNRCNFELVCDKVNSKIIELGKVYPNNFHIMGMMELYNQSLTLPVGYCHGDFSLTNMLFSFGKIYLLDFLNVFIESPIQDLVKLRQDTYHKVGLQLYTKPYNYHRISSALQYMDGKIVDFIKDVNLNKEYRLFQYLNLYRIIPYVKTTNNTKLLDYLLCQMELLNLNQNII